ncbi:MAG: phosphate/phosphite/phosphonate ABC transporter substrate-binding protein [Coriobacteriia bacterium]|nr:phosphate/phosphite/phosphonate ABC transporter substrate-binding protein [Coriobacteriia bacterium]
MSQGASKLSRRSFLLAAGIFGVGALSACSGSNEQANEQAAAPAAPKQKPQAQSGKELEKITFAWLPNESAQEFQAGREALQKVLEEGFGKPVELMTTTDYNVAIEAISSGTAQIAYLGAEGYIQAQERNPKVQCIVTTSDEEGGLEGAMYYSRMAVASENAQEYQTADGYSIDNIKGKRFSFVSPSSTSGFKVPSSSIVSHFGLASSDELTKPGFFSEVLFGNTHQGSAMNMLLGNCDVAAVDDVDLVPYVELVSGEESRPGAVYRVKDNAEPPFDRAIGKEFTIIQSSAVLNAPMCVNTEVLDQETIDKVVQALTDPANSSNEYLFAPEDKQTGALWSQEGKTNFVAVDDSWYEPIRELSKLSN